MLSQGSDPLKYLKIQIVAGIHADDVENFIDMLPRLELVSVSREGAQMWLGMR